MHEAQAHGTGPGDKAEDDGGGRLDAWMGNNQESKMRLSIHADRAQSLASCYALPFWVDRPISLPRCWMSYSKPGAPACSAQPTPQFIPRPTPCLLPVTTSQPPFIVTAAELKYDQ